MRSNFVVLLTLVLTAAAGLSYAEWGAQTDKPDKARERLEIITMWKMMEALDLDKTIADKILEIRHRFLAKRRNLHAGVAKDIAAIKQRLAQTTPPDDKELARLLTDIRAKRKTLMQLRDEQFDEVSKVLTVRQQAELVIFLKEFRKELRQILRPGPGAPSGRQSFEGDPPPGHRPSLLERKPPRGYQESEGLEPEE